MKIATIPEGLEVPHTLEKQVRNAEHSFSAPPIDFMIGWDEHSEWGFFALRLSGEIAICNAWPGVSRECWEATAAGYEAFTNTKWH